MGVLLYVHDAIDISLPCVSSFSHPGLYEDAIGDDVIDLDDVETGAFPPVLLQSFALILGSSNLGGGYNMRLGVQHAWVWASESVVNVLAFNPRDPRTETGRSLSCGVLRLKGCSSRYLPITTSYNSTVKHILNGCYNRLYYISCGCIGCRV